MYKINMKHEKRRFVLYFIALYIIQLCSGITHGMVLNEDIYAQRFQKLIYLHLFTECFMISHQSA